MKETFEVRLLRARKMAGLSLQELSDRMGGIVTKQALSKYEKGVMKPDKVVLESLAQVLEVGVDYFFRQQTVMLGEEVEFRKKASLGVKEVQSIKEKVAEHLERYFALEATLNINSSFTNPLGNYVQASTIKEIDVEEAADKIRVEWNLGQDPLTNVVETLEEHNVKVIELEVEDGFSGLSTCVREVPVVVLNRNHTDIVRKRFTALHELIHLLLNRVLDQVEHKEKEKFCHCLAGALLLPKEPFEKAFRRRGQSVSLMELTFFENYYGISVQATMARAKYLNLIDEGTYRRFHIWLNKEGRRKQTLGQFKGKEEAMRFKKLLYRAAAEELIPLEKAAELANQSLETFKKGLIIF